MNVAFMQARNLLKTKIDGLPKTYIYWFPIEAQVNPRPYGRNTRCIRSLLSLVDCLIGLLVSWMIGALVSWLVGLKPQCYFNHPSSSFFVFLMIFYYPLTLLTEDTYHHHLEVESEYLRIDLIDTAGEVRGSPCKEVYSLFLRMYITYITPSQLSRYL